MHPDSRSRSIFQDMVSTDILVRKIIDFAQHLVQADRASLFLLDSETNQLCAKLFDYGHEEGDVDEDTYQPAKEIRYGAAPARIIPYRIITSVILH